MLIAWKMESARTTRDIDLLGFTTNDLASVKRIVSLICNTRVSEDDGLHFDGSTIKTVRIKEDTPYAGVRVTFQGFLGESRIPMQIDIGFNDIVTPKPQLLEYPTILDHPIPKLKGYTPESIMAEKLEAMVKLGSINSRMKDFFDVWLLSRQLDFRLKTFCAAIQDTFSRRGTKLVGVPSILLEDEVIRERNTMWQAFVERSNLGFAPNDFDEVVRAIVSFIRVPIETVLTNRHQALVWLPPGPWSRKKANRSLDK